MLWIGAPLAALNSIGGGGAINPKPQGARPFKFGRGPANLLCSTVQHNTVPVPALVLEIGHDPPLWAYKIKIVCVYILFLNKRRMQGSTGRLLLPPGMRFYHGGYVSLVLEVAGVGQVGQHKIH